MRLRAVCSGRVKRSSSSLKSVTMKCTRHVATILAGYERLVDTRKNRSAADPFVIALAMANGCGVVTAEAATGKADRPNIPDVCTGVGIRCLGLLEFFRELGWRF